jgi:hypothetical protein
VARTHMPHSSTPLNDRGPLRPITAEKKRVAVQQLRAGSRWVALTVTPSAITFLPAPLHPISARKRSTRTPPIPAGGSEAVRGWPGNMRAQGPGVCPIETQRRHEGQV